MRLQTCINFLPVSLLAIGLLLLPAAYAAENGALIKADELKVEPFRDAKTVTSLAIGDSVDILSKKGGWLKVKSAKGSGWVRMLSIRRNAARNDNSAKELAGLAGLASGRSGTGRIIAATGIRGLNEEQLKAAAFNEEEIKLAESFQTSRTEAKKFASQGKLVARKMDYLPATNTGVKK